jgi:hypothetical protein
MNYPALAFWASVKNEGWTLCVEDGRREKKDGE